MRTSFRVLTAGSLVVIAASGMAYAQKPNLPSPPIQPAPIMLPEGVIPKASTSILRQVKSLTPTQKLGLLKTPTSAIPSEQSLDTPIRLNARTPYVDANTYISVYDAGFNPFFDPPEFLVRGGPSTARVQFRAEPERTYLVDCGFDPSVITQFATRVFGKVVGSSANVAGPNATLAPPPDRHLTFVVRKDSAARDMTIEIHGTGGTHWYLGTCEITPVRGL